MLSRRAFLRSGVQTSALIALAPTVPAFLTHTARAAPAERDGRVLVAIQLEGGNDSINTVVPFKDEGYAKHRHTLRLPTDQLLKINGEVGLHPAMADAARLLENGWLAVVQGVGYPNPSRSHFRSKEIWESARVDRREGSRKNEAEVDTGWLGLALDDGARPADKAPDAVFVGTEGLPLALWGRRAVASSLARPEDYSLTLPGQASRAGGAAAGASDLAAFVTRQTLDAYATCGEMAEVLRARGGSVGYPATELAGRLEVMARLLKGE